MSVDVIIEAGDWPEGVEAICQNVEAALFAERGLGADDYETAILFTNDARMRELNLEFREKDRATNVLSWPAQTLNRSLGENPERPSGATGGALLGDIALGFETCRDEAQAIPFENHITHLVLHGFLHLLGYDHIEQADAEIMEALEIRLLKSLNIPNPYLIE